MTYLKMKTKPFDIKAAKAGARVVTRDGGAARIVCFDRKCLAGHIVALVDITPKVESIEEYTDSGCHFADEAWHELDLMMATDEEGNYIYNNPQKDEAETSLTEQMAAYIGEYLDGVFASSKEMATALAMVAASVISASCDHRHPVTLGDFVVMTAAFAAQAEKEK